MKDNYEISVQLPFGDYAMVEWEMTEEEYDAFLEFCGDEGIWDEDQYQDLLSAASVAAANYIVGFYCETEEAAKFVDSASCTPQKLLEYLGEDEESIADFMEGDGQYMREEISALLFDNQAFYLDEG